MENENKRYVSNKLRLILEVATLSVVLAVSLKVNSDNQKLIDTLREENEAINIKMIKINQEIEELSLQSKLDSLDWTPDEELTGILSMDENTFKTLTDIYLQTSGEHLINEHMANLLPSLEYVGSYSLDRYPADQEIGLPEGYGRYDLVFYIDVEKVEKVMSTDSSEKDRMLKYLRTHGVVGL